MAEAPLFSTLSAVTELFVTAAVYAFIFQAYKRDLFRKGLMAFALTYEVVVNIAYMAFRLLQPSEGAGDLSPAMVALYGFHGTLSLLMFIGLVALVVTAVRLHRFGHNLFRERPKLMWTFVVLWGVSILTGELIYVFTYLV